MSGVVSESVNSGTCSLFSSDFSLVSMFIAIIDTVCDGIESYRQLIRFVTFLSLYYFSDSMLLLRCRLLSLVEVATSSNLIG